MYSGLLICNHSHQGQPLLLVHGSREKNIIALILTSLPMRSYFPFLKDMNKATVQLASLSLFLIYICYINNQTMSCSPKVDLTVSVLIKSVDELLNLQRGQWDLGVLQEGASWYLNITMNLICIIRNDCTGCTDHNDICT